MKQQPRTGFLHWAFPAILALLAITVLLSGRDLSQMFLQLEQGSTIGQNPVFGWSQRFVSLLLLLVAAERITTHVMARKQLASPLLALVFMAYWLATVAVPAVLGSHPRIAHDFVYTLAIGIAAALAGPLEFDKVIVTTRNALFAFLLAGFAMVVVNPSMVLDSSYTQGLLPGVPRFGGLAPHPVALGMFAQTTLLCLWYKPFDSRWLTVLGWLVGGAALFLAQSKNAWIAFFICSVCMLAVRHASNLWRRVGDPREGGSLGVVACVSLIAVVLALLGVLLLGDAQEQLSGFLASEEGEQIMTLTGRDRIWAIAVEEWQNNRLFGYGPDLWDTDFRASIGMPNATSAHNQFMDTLARSGSVGAVALVLYAGVLLFMSVRYARATGGFSLALFLAIALRSITEVPLVLLGYGTELFGHLLLIVTLASAAAMRTQARPAARTHSFYRVAS